MKFFYTVLIWAVVAACAVRKAPSPDQGDADRASKRFPGVTLAELGKGKMLYEQHCAKCHHLKKPDSKTEAEWMRIVPVMAQRAKLDGLSQEYILKYTIALSKPAEAD